MREFTAIKAAATGGLDFPGDSLPWCLKMHNQRHGPRVCGASRASRAVTFLVALAALYAAGALAAPELPPDAPYVVVLGIAQDGGYPQAGCNDEHCLPGWNDPKLRRQVASLAVVDPTSHERWLIDCTPDFPLQLRRLDELTGSPYVLSGILLTHAHIGHYTGLIHLGREVMGTKGVPVYAMPRMRSFLERNGPWDQLVELGNIALQPLQANTAVQLNQRIEVTPILVPHRDEYSETVGYLIKGPTRSVFYLPDIDKWERWQTPIEDVLRRVDVAWLDGTFYDANELPGRSMAEIPHPFLVESMKRFKGLAPELRRRIRFLHLNHSNPALREGSPERAAIEAAGMAIAEQGEIVALQ